MPDSARVLTRLAAIVLVGGLTLGICFAALVPGARQIATAHHYTGSVKSLGELSEPTTVLDANGAVIGKLGSQDREPVELAEVPEILINAVIDTEDKTFWKNPGVDVSGVSRAFVENVTSGEISQGGRRSRSSSSRTGSSATSRICNARPRSSSSPIASTTSTRSARS